MLVLAIILLILILIYVYIHPEILLQPYNALIRAHTKRKVFYTDSEKLEVFPHALELESAWKLIRAEALEVARAANDNVGRHYQRQNDDFWAGWTTYPIKLFDHIVDRDCPATRKLVDRPEIKTAFFSILRPGKHIPAHKGPFSGILRYHLALVVPKGRCYIRVDDSYYHWTEGAGVLFDETYEHEVYNNTDGVRIILFLDVVRPLTGVLNILNRLILLAISHSPHTYKALV